MVFIFTLKHFQLTTKHYAVNMVKNTPQDLSRDVPPGTGPSQLVSDD